MEMKKQYNYLMAIKTTVDSGCLNRPPYFEDENASGLVNLADSLYKDNLKATNWVYGNVTEAQYKFYLFSISSKYNLTSCPLDKPYVSYDEKSCIACEGIYQVGQRTCIRC